jgi:hypothetical protein
MPVMKSPDRDGAKVVMQNNGEINVALLNTLVGVTL